MQATHVPSEASQPDPAPDASICARCGDYAQLRLHWGRLWCNSCMDRRDAIELAPATTANLAKHSLTLSLRIPRSALALTLLIGGVPALLTRHSQLGSIVYQLSVAVIAQAVLQRLAFLKVVAQKPIAFREVLSLAIKRYPILLVTSFRIGIEVVLLSVALIVPGIVRWLDYAIAVPVVLNERVDWDVALAISRTLMPRHRLDTFVAVVILQAAPLLVQTMIAYTGAKHITVLGLNNEFAVASALLVATVLGVPAQFLRPVLHLKLSHARDQLRTSPPAAAADASA